MEEERANTSSGVILFFLHERLTARKTHQSYYNWPSSGAVPRSKLGEIAVKSTPLILTHHFENCNLITPT